MALQNSLAPAPQQQMQQKQTDVSVVYNINNEEIRLDIDMAFQYFTSGKPELITKQELVMFIQMCKYMKLNPFVGEAYLVKYNSSFGEPKAQMIVGKTVLEKRAMRNPRYKGFEAGIFIRTPDGKLSHRTGTLVLQGEAIVGGWARVYVDGYEKPVEATVSMNEYDTGKALWKNKPATMIRKVAKAQALREAFPEELEKLYDASEMGVDDTQLPENPVIVNQQPPIQARQQPEIIDVQPEQPNFADVLEGVND